MIIKNLEVSEKVIKAFLNDYLNLKDEVVSLREQLQSMKERVGHCQVIIQKQDIRESLYQRELVKTKNNLEKVIREITLAPHTGSKEYKELL